LPSTGFDAIAVSLLANSNPIGIIFSSFLVTVISKGSTYMSSASGLESEISSVITGMILLFSACGVFIRYKVKNWKDDLLDRDYWKKPTEYSPQIKDYLKWMIFPSLLGIITCGIGGIILMIIWACNSKDMPRANFFRAQFIITGIGIAIGIIFMLLFPLALPEIMSSMKY